MGQKKWKVELTNRDCVYVTSHEFEVDGGALGFYDMMNDEMFYVKAFGVGTWYSCEESK